MRLRVGLAIGVVVACNGDGGVDPDGAVIDAQVIDGALVDGTVIDGALVDGTVLDGMVLDGAVMRACSTVLPLQVTAPHSERGFVSSPIALEYVAAFQLDTPVPLESLAFETDHRRAMHLYAGCPGAHLASSTVGGRSFDVAFLEWSEGVVVDLAAGSYVIEIVDGPPIWPAALDLRGVIADGAACTGPLVTSGVLACSSRATCVAGTCVVAACSNGLDDDSDGLVDAADPGCALGADLDEGDPCSGGGSCPACADTVDTDGDGAPGWPEPGCLRASDADEHDCPDVDAVVEVLGRGPYAVPPGGVADHPGARHCWTGGGDRVFALQVPGSLSDLRILVGQQAFTLTLYRDHCDSDPVSCTPAVPGWPAISLGALAAGDYWLVASAFASNSGIWFEGALALDARCDPARPAFACASPQSCQPAIGGGHRCQ